MCVVKERRGTDDEEVVVPAVLVTSRKSGPFLLCNFNNHILQPLDKMAGLDRRRGPPRFSWPLPKGDSHRRCTFLGALRHLDLAATTANYVSSALNDRQMKTADWRTCEHCEARITRSEVCLSVFKIAKWHFAITRVVCVLNTGHFMCVNVHRHCILWMYCSARLLLLMHC